MGSFLNVFDPSVWCRFSDKVNTVFLRRMTTLRRDLVHVSELMRNSLVQINEGAPSATSFLHTRNSMSDGGAAGGTVAAAAAAAVAAASRAEHQGPASSSLEGKHGAGRMGGPSPIPSAAVLTPSAAAIANGLGGGNADDSVGK